MWSRMRKVSIQIASPGDMLARDIITDNGNVLLRAHRELNTVLLDRLTKLGIDTVYIEDKLTEDIRITCGCSPVGAQFREVFKRLLEAMLAFTSQVAIFPVASTVLLNTGQTAVVYEVKPSLVTRPIVRIISEADGSPVTHQRNLDLSLHHNLTIVNLL
jgi:hypothetical protein